MATKYENGQSCGMPFARDPEGGGTLSSGVPKLERWAS